jgi:SAM-dependent methyltransferase
VGRNTGKPHQVILRYITSGDNRIIMFPQNTDRQDWIKNLVKNPTTKIFYDEKSLLGRSKVKQISGLQDPLLSAFTRKYGESTARRWYWGQRTYVEFLAARSLGSLNYAEMVYGDLEAAFDSVAQDYDHHIFDNPINSWLRNVSLREMTRIFKRGDTVLEMGCGTGTETLGLARSGVNVVAVDISGKMLSVLSRKAKALGLSDKITTIHCRPSQLNEKTADLGIKKLDGAYSTYGAINTEPNLGSMIRMIHSLLKPNSTLLLGVWNKFCAYEIIGYLLKANPTLAFSRLRNPVPIGKSRFCISSNAFSVEALSEYMDQYFELRRVTGVVILLPPSNLTNYLPKGILQSALKKLDSNLGKTFPANRLGDHFLAEYRKKEKSE